MHPEWKEHLVAVGARVTDEGSVRDFGNEAAEASAVAREPVLLDLSATHAAIRASGADAAAFLNGQLTNDTRRLEPDGSCLAGYCTPQGRLLAIVRVLRRGDDFLLLVPQELRDDLLARLRKFVLRAKVALEPLDELVLVGVAGPHAADLLTRAGVPAPDAGASSAPDGSTVLRLPGPRDRFVLLAPVAAATTWWRALQAHGARAVAGHWWVWFDVEAGVPEVYRATQEKFVPQTANLELVGGVSFDKGCYPGQEIVARVHYLGRLKERMYRLHLPHDGAPLPGDALYAPDLPGQSTGTVVHAHASPEEHGVDLLAVVHTSSVANDDLRWKTPDGPRLAIGTLPYPLPQPRS